MANLTDLPSQGGQEGKEDPVRAVLMAAADHLADLRPDEPLDADVLVLCIGAEAYRAAGRISNGEALTLARAAKEAAPELADGMTRWEYAELVRVSLPSSAPGEDGDATR